MKLMKSIKSDLSKSWVRSLVYQLKISYKQNLSVFTIRLIIHQMFVKFVRIIDKMLKKKRYLDRLHHYKLNQNLIEKERQALLIRNLYFFHFFIYFWSKSCVH